MEQGGSGGAAADKVGAGSRGVLVGSKRRPISTGGEKKAKILANHTIKAVSRDDQEHLKEQLQFCGVDA